MTYIILHPKGAEEVYSADKAIVNAHKYAERLVQEENIREMHEKLDANRRVHVGPVQIVPVTAV